MREQQRALQLGEARVVDAGAREEPEAGVDAVDGAVLGDEPRDGRRRRVDRGPRGGVDREFARRRPDVAQGRERQSSRNELDRHRGRARSVEVYRVAFPIIRG
jgi:hypothetical protein